MTKGQYSPTSEVGKVTKSSPYGSVEQPIRPVNVALAAEATFVARSIDRWPHHLSDIIKQAYEHKGTSLVEIYQNCNIFNDGAFFDYTEKDVKDDNTLLLKDGKPLLFGSNEDKGIILDGTTPKVVKLGKKYTKKDLLIHHENEDSPVMSHILANIEFYGGPVPVGVFRAINRPCFEESIENQIENAITKNGKGDIAELIKGINTWKVN